MSDLAPFRKALAETDDRHRDPEIEQFAREMAQEILADPQVREELQALMRDAIGKAAAGLRSDESQDSA